MAPSESVKLMGAIWELDQFLSSSLAILFMAVDCLKKIKSSAKEVLFIKSK